MALSADQRRAFAMLATAGQDGVAQALLSAHGFDATMIAGLVHRGLAGLTMEKVRANGKLIAVRITETDGAVSLPRIELIRELGSYPNRISYRGDPSAQMPKPRTDRRRPHGLTSVSCSSALPAAPIGGRPELWAR
jgi:hypothetical protein